ncbi:MULTISPECIES: cysteine hydrolase family protein [Pseudomonas]|jgi:nicotinamidase-related amidase|uniref:Cysteine hydrolase n=1 Tax=Pseudomonas orientalis TaxID=76758 RepID=A0A4Q7CX44_9PSED|nr:MULTISPECIES: cysteine hydrolase family protein [Pseudomonas]POM12956.1 cysteine hydrolase [Pseudomonas sp. WP001]MBY8927915.1 cysteine hydrolase [Pseudomonas sp. Wu6]RZI30012.1 cysteine hydrolase [Pseudomonas orientalis]CRM03399.1 Streptothricin hydrolase [Pseudomonas sp. 24 E 13]CRM09620.1 Streptothricin hydrolase [Pseudomonas sp. 44 R 15]
MAKQALILIDIQNDYFPQGKWPLDGVEAAADNAAQVLKAFRQTGDAVIHVRHEFADDDAPFFTPGSEGAQLHANVLNQGNEPVVLKHFVNAFRQTNLRELLERRSITDVVVVGSMSHMCIDAVVRAAADLGYKVTVIHDACATCDQNFNGQVIPAAQVHGAYMAALAFGYASVVSTQDYLKAQAAVA